MELPAFRYHRDPVATGSIVAEREKCVWCGEERSHMYNGGLSTTQDVDGRVCAWCVADGSAAETFAGTLVDSLDVANLDESILEELTKRTPGYVGWQQEVWLSHCDDACVYLDRVGLEELRELPPGATTAVREALGDWGRSEVEREELFSYLHREGDMTAHLFQCLHCSGYQATVDVS